MYIKNNVYLEKYYFLIILIELIYNTMHILYSILVRTYHERTIMFSAFLLFFSFLNISLYSMENIPLQNDNILTDDIVRNVITQLYEQKYLNEQEYGNYMKKSGSLAIIIQDMAHGSHFMQINAQLASSSKALPRDLVSHVKFKNSIHAIINFLKQASYKTEVQQLSRLYTVREKQLQFSPSSPELLESSMRPDELDQREIPAFLIQEDSHEPETEFEIIERHQHLLPFTPPNDRPRSTPIDIPKKILNHRSSY